MNDDAVANTRTTQYIWQDLILYFAELMLKADSTSLLFFLFLAVFLQNVFSRGESPFCVL